jgi:hypothetical protein
MASRTWALLRQALVVCSVVAACPAPASAAVAVWSWQKPHAVIAEHGGLRWAPLPFAYDPGESVRYIDFEGGDDSNSGTSKVDPWKRHPWDPAAQDNAAACSGVHTYVFKRGVSYRGRLATAESGESDNPIRLTSDPSWGEGPAAVQGSIALTSGWERGSANSAPASMPDPESVWYQDIGTSFYPRAVWLVDGEAIVRVPMAREPDWQVSNPDDVKSDWYTWEHVEKVQVDVGGGRQERAWCVDSEHLTDTDPDAYGGGTVWTEYSGVMGTPYASPIEAYDPGRHAIRCAGPWGSASYAPIIHCRYFLENLPRFLDSPGEYYYAADGPYAGRLYLRLPGDRDPSEVVVEVASELTLIDIRDQSHIQISGLTFRFQNVVHWYDRWWTVPEQDPACVKVLGGCSGVSVSGCTFEHVVRALHARSGGDGIMDRLAFTDNDIRETDYGAILVENGGGTPPAGNLYAVSILRNRLRRIGLRPMRAHHGHAVSVNFALLPEIAGNFLDRCWGAGLFVFGGKGAGDITRPLSRVLIHHNQVTDPLLNTNDWGGVEFWQGGPAYIYSNISGNPGGYWHWSHVMRGASPDQRELGTARFAFAYYLDGAFKCYVFNNVAWGKSNDLTSPLCNASAFQEVIGFFNRFFNNTAYNMAAGSRRQGPQAGRNHYLGNLWLSISDIYFRHSDARTRDENLSDVVAAGGVGDYDLDTLAYSRNVFHGTPRSFGVFEDDGTVRKSLETFRLALEACGTVATDVGTTAEESPVRDAAAHDFRPRPNSGLAGQGVKYFVPWGLGAVVGEWHFYHYPQDPRRVLDEHWYLTDAYVNRAMYRHVPHHDLTAHCVTADSYVRGPLEDWTHGALVLDGLDQYCSLADRDMKSTYTWDGSTYPGERRVGLDMGTNSFLIEAYLRVEPGHADGIIAAKNDGTGYALEVDGAGRPRLALGADGRRLCSRVAVVPINDGQWHHVVAEVDRATPQGITLYVDGRRADGEWLGQMPPVDLSLANTADFVAGRGLAATFDFLRVARGTLGDSRTTIEELYEWEFDGPFLKDFFGNASAEGRRCAGAMDEAR